MSTLVEIVVGVLSGVVLLFSLIGLGVRFVLLPYLKEHLIEPVQETNKQVTVNHHSSAEPTVLDRIDDVRLQVKDVHAEVVTVARMFDGHLDWSQDEVDKLWKALQKKRDNHE